MPGVSGEILAYTGWEQRGVAMDKCYNHILVPLDGSELAESALDDAFSLAKLSHAEVTLLQVIPTIEGTVIADRAHALRYLETICERFESGSLTVHPAVMSVVMESAAQTIIDYAHQNPIDLIVMATHGWSGLKRWVYDSTAEKVLRGAKVPVVLVRACPQTM
jgi:nucleotide-binding universal stress UspA family protein